MSAAYSTEGWKELFICAGGATAALSGLIFVGLSINIQTVLDIDRREGHNFLTGRALEAFVALLNVLAISIVALTPAISRGVLAAFILLIAAASAISPATALRVSGGRNRLAVPMLIRVVLATATTLALLTAGVTLATEAGGGLFWLPAAFVLAITVAAINAWVLLVEVLR
ncbi:hypothetical protein [Streptomyces sp. NPDC088725]|uniref:hypothetical protein n=1 Tax=Streptomyces sp. NPDC088725 TaxID=3365873 RepID=UPI0037FB633D